MKLWRVIDEWSPSEPGLNIERSSFEDEQFTFALHLILAITWPRRRWVPSDYNMMIAFAKPQAWIRVSLHKSANPNLPAVFGWPLARFEVSRGITYVDEDTSVRKHIAKRSEIEARGKPMEIVT